MLKVKKGAKKRCCYGLCRSDTRSKSYPENLYYFISFPKPCFEFRRKLITTTTQQHIKGCPKCAKCDLWVKSCGRADGRFELIDHVTKDTYICSLHFVGESGPTTEYPDPISCVKLEGRNKVKISRNSLAEKYEETHNNMHQGIEYVNLNLPAENMVCEDVNGVFFNDGDYNVAASFSFSQNLSETFASNPFNEETTSVKSENCEISTSMDIHIKSEPSPYDTCDQGVQNDFKLFTS